MDFKSAVKKDLLAAHCFWLLAFSLDLSKNLPFDILKDDSKRATCVV
jgi:hypothetical protein